MLGLRDGGIYLYKIEFLPKHIDISEENPKILAYLPSNRQIEKIEVVFNFQRKIFLFFQLKKNI